VISRVAIAFAIVGLAIAGYFLWRGPAVTATSVPLAWTTGPLDAGALEVEFSVGGVDFLRAQDTSEPALSFAVVRRGEQHLVLDDFNFFHAVEVHDGRLWAIGESTTEGPGPSLELLVSEDEGRTFEHRASVPKPNYQAMFERWTVRGDELTLVLSLDDETALADDWVWPIPRWQRSCGPGRFALHSKNGGRSWRLER
jgi:hypothetical protein